MVDQAIAFCAERVDVFGMGLFSEGPGSDLLYHRAHAPRTPSVSEPLRCPDQEGNNRVSRARSLSGQIGMMRTLRRRALRTRARRVRV